MDNAEKDRKRERPRHPRGLKGAAIGMYYKNLKLEKQKEAKANGEAEETENTAYGPNVSIPPGIIEKASSLLNSVLKDELESVKMEFGKHFQHLMDNSFDNIIDVSKNKNAAMIRERLRRSPSVELQCNRKQKPATVLKERLKLPAMKHGKDILRAIKDNQIVLIAGDTGCGKTTQVPQLILDEFLENNQTKPTFTIVCTQPRRLSTIAVADRVAFERSEKMGLSVGYQIRLECCLPTKACSIKFCTTGILLQQMEGDVLLRNLDVIILDEIHERSQETDLLMALLKKVLPYRQDLRIILMSATVRENDFRDYFDGCFTFHIKGTLYPVQDVYLEDILSETNYQNFNSNSKSLHKSRPGELDYDSMIKPYLKIIKYKYEKRVLDILERFPSSEGCENLEFIQFLVFYICRHKPAGAILVFLPGYDHITKLYNMLKSPSVAIGAGMQDKMKVFALHSMLPTFEQKDVFLPSKEGVRKVILSTTIAETSVTIDDVVYVINTGRVKVSSYDVKLNLQTLSDDWTTKANNYQRRGRAGRVQPGICYHLFTRAREARMQEIPLPQILCCKMDSIILNLKLLHIHDISEFLNSLITPPAERAIKNGIQLLKRIEALNDDEIITPLGMHLARLPVDPQTGKLIFMAALFRCIDPITSVAAALSYKSPFFSPMGFEQKVDVIKRNLSKRSSSDHLLYHQVIREYRDSYEEYRDHDYCSDNFLSKNTIVQLENMKGQFAKILRESRFLESDLVYDPVSNKTSTNKIILRAVITAGLYPNMAFLKKIKILKRHTIHTMFTPEDRRVQFHPSSINCGATSFESHFFAYFRKHKSTEVFLMDASMIYPMALLIFGDKVTYENGKISVGNAFFFDSDDETAELIFLIRERLEWLMQKKALWPSVIKENTSEENIIKAIQLVLSLDKNVYDDDEDEADDYYTAKYCECPDNEEARNTTRSDDAKSNPRKSFRSSYQKSAKQKTIHSRTFKASKQNYARHSKGKSSYGRSQANTSHRADNDAAALANEINYEEEPCYAAAAVANEINDVEASCNEAAAAANAINDEEARCYEAAAAFATDMEEAAGAAAATVIEGEEGEEKGKADEVNPPIEIAQEADEEKVDETEADADPDEQQTYEELLRKALSAAAKIYQTFL